MSVQHFFKKKPWNIYYLEFRKHIISTQKNIREVFKNWRVFATLLQLLIMNHVYTRLLKTTSFSRAVIQTFSQHRRVLVPSLHFIVQEIESENHWKWGGGAGTPDVVGGKSTWIEDYLIENPVYREYLFWRQFAVPIGMFWRIYNALVKLNLTYWGTWKIGLFRKGIDF